MDNSLPDHPDIASALRTGYPTWAQDYGDDFDETNEICTECPYYEVCKDLSFDGDDYADCKTAQRYAEEEEDE